MKKGRRRIYLTKIRQLSGYSNREIGEQLGIGKDAYHALETGRVRELDAEIAVRIAMVIVNRCVVGYGTKYEYVTMEVINDELMYRSNLIKAARLREKRSRKEAQET